MNHRNPCWRCAGLMVLQPKRTRYDNEHIWRCVECDATLSSNKRDYDEFGNLIPERLGYYGGRVGGNALPNSQSGTWQ